MNNQQLINDINQSIKTMQYNEWDKFNKLDFTQCHTKYDIDNKSAGHYGVSIYKSEPSKSNYEFYDFIARCILSDNDIYGLYQMYDLNRHNQINCKSDFDSYVHNFYNDDSKNLMPNKQYIKQGYTFGDGNERIIFIEFDTFYVMYRCFGS